MPDIILKDFSAGMDGRRLNAPVNSLQDCRNIVVSSGSASAVAGNADYTDEAVTFEGDRRTPVDLMHASERVAVELQYWLAQLVPGTAPALGINPIYKRAEAGRETMTQIGGYWYIAPDNPQSNALDYCMRWDGETYRYTMQKHPSYTPPASMTAWLLGAKPLHIRPGWLMWFGTETAGVTNWAGNVRITRVEHAPTSATTIITNEVTTPENYNRCCIVNTERMGIKPPQTSAGAALPPTTALKAGGTLAAGDYQYLFRLVSEDITLGTGGSAVTFKGIDDVSNPSDPCAAVTIPGGSGEQTITVTIPEADGFPACVSAIEVYRRVKPSGGTYGDWKLIKTEPAVSITAVSGWRTQVKAFAFDDTGALAEGQILPGDAYYHEMPGLLRQIRAFNGRLYATETGTKRNRLRFSTLGSPNSWPYDIAGVLGYVADTQYLGGYQDVGDSSKIVALLPESGAYDSTGQVGDNLIVFKRAETYRWFGTDWSNFRLQYAFPVGCIAMRTAQNCNGLIVWKSSHQIMSIPAGGGKPTPLTKGLFPDGYKPTLAEDSYSAAYWRNYYIVRDDVLTLLLDMDTGAWTRILTYPVAFAVVPYRSDMPPETLLSVSLEGEADVVYSRVFAAAAPADQARIVTQPLALVSRPEDAMRAKRIRRVWVGYTNQTSAAVPMWLSINGETNTLYFATAPVAKTSTIVPERMVAFPIDPPVISPVVQLEIGADLSASTSGTFSIDWIGLDFEYLAVDVERPSSLDISADGAEYEP